MSAAAAPAAGGGAPKKEVAFKLDAAEDEALDAGENTADVGEEEVRARAALAGAVHSRSPRPG